MDLSKIRNDYQKQQLSKTSVADTPILQLEKWLKEAEEANCNEYTAMTVATITPSGQPTLRIVLLKYIEEDGLVFFTNYKSRKGLCLEVNPRIAAHFFWPELERQIKIEGVVVKTSEEISDKYFQSRPFESQISAIISNQSQEVPNREYLEDLREQEIERHLNDVPERPKHWGGYKIKPNRIEFWQGGSYRLHDRILYKKDGDNWKISRLAP